jgi:hypothetical protein
MDKSAILDALQAAHDKYFSLLLEQFRLIHDTPNRAPVADFGPPELCGLAIEVHACAIALGPKARERLSYLGLDLLYPFDNPVDLYNWQVRVKKENIDHTAYASIAIRIDSELKRIRRAFELGGEAAYEVTPAEAFLVSKARYKSIVAPKPDEGNSGDGQSELRSSPPSMHIGEMNIQYTTDSQAVNRLEKLEKGTSIGSNVSNIISALRTIFG